MKKRFKCESRKSINCNGYADSERYINKKLCCDWGYNKEKRAQE